MYIFFVIPSFFIFLYTLFKLVKDDHVFFRRNIKLEHFFDYAILSTLSSWIFVHVFNVEKNEQVTVAILIASLILFAIAKYKKIPVGRFFDFFSLSFITSIPLWFFMIGLFSKNIDKIIYILSASIFLITAIYFNTILFPKIMNRTLKEGTLSIFFIVFYSFYSILISLYNIVFSKSNILSAGNFIVLLMLISSVPLLIKVQK